MTIYLCIILNTVILALNWFDMPNELTIVFDQLNNAFTAIFTIEAFIKITIQGKQYFKEGWNIFDCVILVGAFI